MYSAQFNSRCVIISDSCLGLQIEINVKNKCILVTYVKKIIHLLLVLFKLCEF